MIITTPNVASTLRNQLQTTQQNRIPVLNNEVVQAQLVDNALPEITPQRQRPRVSNFGGNASIPLPRRDTAREEAAFSSPLPPDFAANWQDSERVRDVQRSLSDLGLYRRRIDGDPGPFTQSGLIALALSAGLI